MALLEGARRPPGLCLAFGIVAAVGIGAVNAVAAVEPTPLSCDAASVQAALSAGGDYEFQCSATIEVARNAQNKPVPFVLSGQTASISEGTGAEVSLSGIGASRVMTVNGGGKLTLRGVTIRNGFHDGQQGLDAADGSDGTGSAAGGAGGTGGPATAGRGGALYVEAGSSATLSGVTLLANLAYGGVGGDGGDGGDGREPAGGTGGPGGRGGDGGPGANAEGGAIFNAGTLTVTGSVFEDNEARGGSGGNGGGGGGGGDGGGYGGDGADGADGGDGGTAADGLGGAIYSSGQLSLTDSTFQENGAWGGTAGYGGYAGFGGYGSVADSEGNEGGFTGPGGDGADGGDGGDASNGGGDARGGAIHLESAGLVTNPTYIGNAVHAGIGCNDSSSNCAATAGKGGLGGQGEPNGADGSDGADGAAPGPGTAEGPDLYGNPTSFEFLSGPVGPTTEAEPTFTFASRVRVLGVRMPPGVHPLAGRLAGLRFPPPGRSAGAGRLHPLRAGCRASWGAAADRRGEDLLRAGRAPRHRRDAGDHRELRGGRLRHGRRRRARDRRGRATREPRRARAGRRLAGHVRPARPRPAGAG